MAQSAGNIGAAIQARMEGRTVATGAETDLGVKVFQGKRTVDEAQMPCSSLIEGDDIPDKVDGGTQALIRQRYALVAFMPCDPNNPNLAGHAAIRDLKRAIWLTNGKPDRSLGGLVKHVRYIGRDISPRPDGTAFLQAGIEIEVEFVEDLWNP